MTGAAGFIGFHTAGRLLARGERVIGIDCLTGYGGLELKRDRLAELERFQGFVFHQTDLADDKALAAALAGEKICKVIHLAAQPGVRYSIENPHAYIHSNISGHLNVLEFCRHHDAFEHLCYASSSSVYGGNEKLPYCESDPVDHPVSLYAATKRADELISHSYAHLYRMPQTGLRFFTVYGPWGRPDMAVWLFTEALFGGKPIEVFNRGQMGRDLTYIDDVTEAILAAAGRPPKDDDAEPPHRIYNVGNNQPVPLLRLIEVLEQATGRQAQKAMMPMQPGDVKQTYADIAAAAEDFGFAPKTDIETGVARFVDWYRSYRGIDR